jgi:RND superfamily putative drug exporter
VGAKVSVPHLVPYSCAKFAAAAFSEGIRAELDRTGDPRAALTEGLAGSGRVINAAGLVMVVVFFTFALSGPLAPKEMGVILGVAVLLDTLLVRLLLLPAVLRLLGPAAWWTPRLLGRLPLGLRLRHS